MAESQYIRTLRKLLKGVADPGKADAMQAYMKSKMPYHGVPSPVAKKVFKELFGGVEFANARAWVSDVRSLWQAAKFREERYAALHLCKHKAARAFQDLDAIDLYEFLIVDGAWWDYVDDIAIHMVGPIFDTHRSPMKKLMLQWATCDDLWKRRSAIICQIGSKDVDFEFLKKCIEPSIGSKEFFLRKGIGWVLRDIAWSEPKMIARYVKDNAQRLSPLSQREALKNMQKLKV